MNETAVEHKDQMTIGQSLRGAREARGISREEAAAATRIKPVFLAAMEDDDYHLLPDERYLLRFVAEYATFLNLNPEEVQHRFSERIARDRGSLAIFPVKRTVTLSLRRLLPALLLLAFLVPTVFIGLSLMANWDWESRGPERSGQSESVGVGSPTGTLPSIGETFVGDPSAAARSDLPEPGLPSDAQEAPYTLRAQAQEMTWMLVTIDDRETRDVLLRAGETWEWRAKEGFVLTVGNAGGVALILNGTLLPQLGEAGQVIRDLRLPTRSTSTAEMP